MLLKYIIADVFPPWHCVNTHVNGSDQHTAKTSAFIKVLTLEDLAVSHPLTTFGSSTGVLSFSHAVCALQLIFVKLIIALLI